MMMEWNPKTPALWDWDNPTFFSAAAAAAAGTGAAAGSGGGGSPSGSSASIDSSPYIRPPSVAFEAAQEPPIGLKLGKRTYFEDVCVGSGGAGAATAAAAAGSRNPASSSTSSSPSAAAGTVAVGEVFVKRLRVAHQSVQVVRCQVEGCNIDLTGGKEYHRKHRVCEGHSKSPLVVVAGQQRRFCQQCSRFHDPSAFDEKKRSCRKRLADHNARRRKPQQGAISYNPVKLTSSFCDERQQMSLLFNRAPFGHVRPSAISTWEGSCDFKFSHVKGPWTKSTKGGIEGQLLPGTDLSSSVTTLHHDLDRLSPFKVTTTEILNQGTEASAVSSNLNGASDIRRALSLLSTDSWGSAEPARTTSLAQLAHTNQTGAVHAIHAANAASHYWEDEQPLHPPVPPARVLPFALQSNSSHFQEFQLFKSPYDGSFFDSSQIH